MGYTTLHYCFSVTLTRVRLDMILFWLKEVFSTMQFLLKKWQEPWLLFRGMYCDVIILDFHAKIQLNITKYWKYWKTLVKLCVENQNVYSKCPTSLKTNISIISLYFHLHNIILIIIKNLINTTINFGRS